MLRHKSDLKTITYILTITALMIVLFVFHNQLPFYVLALLYAAELILSISVGVMVHNHRHVTIWKNKTLNNITDCWLSVLYGFPVFGWIPTHLQNHHTYTNKEPDYTKTYAYSEKNNFWTILYYPMYSSKEQKKAIRKYISDVKKKDQTKFIEHVMQILTLLTVTGICLIIDWKAALLFVVIPQQIALNSVLFFNYIQHIHADELSEYNHSRNIEGILNVFLFNNGLHTAHHLKPHLHWSRVPEFHEEIRDKIDPRLIEQSLIWYLIRQYVLSPFNKKLSTRPMRLHSKQS
tara:strand:+ start:503 stop:1375 length:873 start_codon:yes stop_codon:yes gene_type:complete